MTQLWAFFKNSAKRLKTYIKIAMQVKDFEILRRNKKAPLLKKKAVRTRWLSLDVGVASVLKEYTYLMHALRSMKDQSNTTGPTATRILKRMDNIKFLGVLYILKVMLPHLSTLSKTFKNGELNFSRILTCY